MAARAKSRQPKSAQPPPPRGPQPIGRVIRELMARRGLGRQLAAQQAEQAWQEAVGEPLGSYTRAGRIYRRRLEVTVRSSTVIQELTFQKPQLLHRLRAVAPQLEIDDIRFRQGALPSPETKQSADRP